MPSYATRRPSNRRGKKPEYDPLERIAKMVADQAWEKANRIVERLAPEQPADTDQLDEQTQWLILQEVAINMSPEFWDDPEAIEDFARLTQKFAPGVPVDHLKPIAQAKRASNRALPDLSITPENPEYERMERRMRRSA